jgi:hypothetical protein
MMNSKSQLTDQLARQEQALQQRDRIIRILTLSILTGI